MTTILPIGTELTSDSGNKYFIDSVISTGTGQGDIYLAHGQTENYAVKIFHSGEPQKILEQIELLIRRGRICSAYVYPKDIVRIDGRVGYVMDYVDGNYFSNSAILYNGKKVGSRQIELGFNEKIELLINILEAYNQLYQADLCVADIKFDNIMVNSTTGEIRILDVDTILDAENSDSIVTGTIAFMPPLTMLGVEKPTKYNDSYALAVIIFMTLLSSHPLVGANSEKKIEGDVNRYLYADHPLYIFHPTNTDNRPIPCGKYGANQQRTIDRMKVYPDYFKKAMERTFVDGLFVKENRVEPAEWIRILDRLYRDYFTCSGCGEEIFYTSNQTTCLVCGANIITPVSLQGDICAPLFNQEFVYANQIFINGGTEKYFLVTVSEYDGKFGLENYTADNVILKLKNMEKVFRPHEVIPIFLDSTLTVFNHELKFIYGGIK